MECLFQISVCYSVQECSSHPVEQNSKGMGEAEWIDAETHATTKVHIVAVINS